MHTKSEHLKIWNYIFKPPIAVFFFLSFFTASFSQIIWSENFDGSTANWVVATNQPTPAGIAGLNYTANGSCNNYWIINDAHTPDYNNNYYGHRALCNNLPNPITGNKSLHITYQSCAAINGSEPAPANGGDAYSWQGSNSNSDQWVYYNADINTTGACGLYLEFWAYLGGDTSSTNDYVDRSILYSIDGGTTWKVLVEDLADVFDNAGNRIYDITTAGTCKGWTKFSIEFPSDANNISNLRIAFRFRNENPASPGAGDYTTSSGFNIDDIKIVSRAFDVDFQADQTTVCRNITTTFASFFVSQPPVDPFNPPSYSYAWSFSPSAGVTYVNGTSSTDPSIQVQFANAGTYTVTLTVTQSGGNCSGQSETITKTNYITVLPSCPPTASFTSDITQVCATNPTPTPQSVTEVQLIDQSQSAYPITSWNWNITGPGTVTFTGGTNASSQNPTVSFGAVGLYTVQLTVTNADGSDDTTVTSYIEAIDCQCNTTGGGTGTSVTTLDSVTFFGLSSFPSGWATSTTGTNNTFVVGNNYTAVSSQPAGIANPNTEYAFVTCNSFLCSLIGMTGTPAYYDDGSFLTEVVSLQTNDYVVASYDSVALSFWYTVQATSTDYGAVEYSTDGGTTWTQLATNMYAQPTWTQVSYTVDLNALGNPTNIRFRWTFSITHDANAADPGLCLDDIILHAYAPGGGSGPNGVFTCPLATTMCEGDNVTVTFNAIGTFNAGNQFIAQLSDASGSFASPTTLGTMNASGTNLTNQTMTVTIPTPATCGATGYRIRVVSTNPAYNSPPSVTDNGSDITINCKPNAFTISGNTSVCENSLETYSVTSQTGATYNWTVTGGTISSGQGTNSINVLWGTAGTGTVSLTITNGCGSTTNNINVNITGSPTISAITGNTNVCVGNNQTYSVTNNSGSSYTWTLTGGGTITSGAGTNSITINWTTQGVYTLKVVETNGCGSDSTEITIAVNDVPTSPTITGSTSACPNDTVTYYVSPVPGATYNWTVSNGNILGGQGTNALVVEWTTLGTGTVSLTLTNSCGSANASVNVTIGSSITVSGFAPDSVCKSAGTTTQATHSINPISGATYTWTVISGGTLVSSSGNSATVDWNNSATSLQLQVSVSTACGTKDTTFNVYFKELPQLSAVTGNASVCVSANESYSVNVTAGSGVNVTWNLVNNLGTPTSGTGNTANITWNTAGTDSIVFTATNSCGTVTSKMEVTVQNATPVSDISGNMDVCTNATETYSVNNISGATYNWTVNGGSISSGQGTNSISVQWGSTAGSYQISVSVTQGCGTITRDTTIILNTVPSISITGNSTVCVNTTETYSVPLQTGVTYSWNLVNGLGTPTSGTGNTTNITWNTAGTDSIVFTATNSCGTATSKLEVIVGEINFTATLDDSVLCIGDNFNYNVTGTYGALTVNFGDGNSSTTATGSHSYTSAGNYTVEFIATQGSCSDTIKKNVLVYAPPTLSISANPNPSFLPTVPTISANPNNADTLIYSFGSGYNSITQTGTFSSVTVPYNQPGQYTVFVYASNQGGCSVSDSVTVIIEEGVKIFLPNAFTPNGDGINDFYEIQTTGLENYVLEIYDRWGNVITKIGMNERWDGTVNGTPAQEGSYIIVLRAKGRDGNDYVRTTTMTLLR